MAHFKKPAPGKDLSQTYLAASLERDKNATLAGELDLGLEGDPDLRTRTGQASLLRPRRNGRSGRVIVLFALVSIAAAAWLLGALEQLGVPPPPRALGEIVQGLGDGGAESGPTAR